MTTYYSVSKCNYVAFVRSDEDISDDFILGKIYNYESIKQVESIKDDEFTIIVDTLHNDFKDIKFQIDQNKEGINSSSIKTQDVLGKENQNNILGSGNMLDGFNSGKFVVIPGKSNASIQPCHIKQNHEVCDELAKNGILTCPTVSTELSIGKLMNVLVKKNKFNIIIKNPYLSQSTFHSKYVNSYSRPVYTIGKGEICAVFFRYLAKNFFGYMSVYDDSNPERSYDI